MSKRYKEKKLLPAFVIRAASEGDPYAIQMVLKHYERLILHYCSICLYSEDGEKHVFVNEALRQEIELKVIKKTLGFEYKPAA